MIQHYLDALLRQEPTVNPLLTFLNGRLVKAHAGEAVVAVPVSRSFVQGAGLVSGGILATLADEAMAHAVLSQVDPGFSTVTAELSVRFLHPADPAKVSSLTATAKIVNKGKKLIDVEALVQGDDSTALVKATAIFWLLPRAV